MPPLQTLALAGALSVIAALFAVLAVDGPVSRVRVQQFVDRHDLRLTADNSPLIVAYLATTRRWRAAGLVGGLTAHAVLELRNDRIGVSVVYLLAGWFAGALIAEVRVAGLLTRRRAASLAPRTLDRYLSLRGRRALPWSVLASLTLTAVAALRTEQEPGRVAVSSVVTVAVALVVWLTTRRVLRRPQPVVPDDVLAADNAIRSRSLHAVTASGVTLVLYCALSQLLAILADGWSGLVLAVMLLGAVAVPRFGWRLATAPWAVRPAPVPA
jgi:hypothetical protein